MGLTVAIVLLVALLVLLIVLAISVSRLRRRQVASYTPEERRRQGVRGAWVRLGDDIRELDDAALDRAAPAAVRDAHVTEQDGRVVPDPERARPGRGAYLHPDAECLERALRRGGFHRALRRTVEVPAETLEWIDAWRRSASRT